MSKCEVLYKDDQLNSVLASKKPDKPFTFPMYFAALTVDGYPLATSGYSTCMGLLVHDLADDSKKGALGHLPGFGSSASQQAEALKFLTSVIGAMLGGLGLKNDAPVQIVMLEGKVGYSQLGLPDEIKETYTKADVLDLRRANQGDCALYLPASAVVVEYTNSELLKKYGTVDKSERVKTLDLRKI
ncbi:MAG TPA: hypothetical protein VMH32_01750 [Burkholderiales bacterium]|nr:hypothetical protein [Burkholderiales bacterium]